MKLLHMFLIFHYTKIHKPGPSNSLFIAFIPKGKRLPRQILGFSLLLIFSITKQDFNSCFLKKKNLSSFNISEL
jgi:hypothetical protein